MSILKPYKFTPILKQLLWGGEKIASFKGYESHLHNVGESWEISSIEGNESVVAEGEDAGLNLSTLIGKYKEELVGEAVYKKFGTKFPLLIKFIDAKLDLSVQVHPRDQKTEMWYLIDCDQDAKILEGFNRQLCQEEYEAHVANNTITDVISHYASHQGDTFFIPSGQVHSIGGGNLLAEIQQASAVTYRIYDYDRTDADGNKRELHTEQAKHEIIFDEFDGRRTYDRRATNKEVELVECQYFTVNRVVVDNRYEMPMPGVHNFKILMCTKGKLNITDNNGNATRLCQGETVLIPANLTFLALDGQGECLVIFI